MHIGGYIPESLTETTYHVLSLSCAYLISKFTQHFVK